MPAIENKKNSAAMALLRRSGNRFTTNIWPGFVDAMTALLLVLMFVLSIFMIIQTVFREKISGQESELTKLEAEVSQLIADLGGQKERYQKLNSTNLLIKQELEMQREITLDRSQRLKNALKNLDLASVKISDFEVRVASLIARRTQLLTQIEQRDNRLKKEVSRLEASKLALASAREEIDAEKETARLAAAKTEALEAMVKGLTLNLNELGKEKKELQSILDQKDLALVLAYENLKETKERLTSSERESLIKQAAIENLKNHVIAKSELVADSSRKIVRLEENLEETNFARTQLIKDLESKEKELSDKEEELLLETIAKEKLRKQSTEKLDESERQILVEKLALQEMRRNLAESREELELATLSLEEERRRALDNLELIAASETAKKMMEESNINLVRDKNLLKSQLVRTSDLLKIRESAISKLRSQVLSNESSQKLSLERVKNLNEETISLANQLNELQNLLEDYEQKDIETKAQVENLGGRLNAALAQVVLEQKKSAKLEAERLKKLEAEAQELKNYRSEFFGNLRQILGTNKGVKIVGDRFLLPSEILFNSGSDELEVTGMRELAQIAIVIKKILEDIPENIDWILRVDGHTDKTKFLSEVNFKDNWELSQARALSVVRYFVYQEGLPARRFAAAGFGEFQPIDLGDTEDSLAQNRRIEIKLTER
ncbi:MAG: peptidoglycan -binding protein [Paracoccaceae bacterium]|nr:peptidoglycan -binding protein [Paracoccaceae bacterium]